MAKRIKEILLLITVCLLLLPLVFYIINSRQYLFSADPEVWSYFRSNQIGALTPLIALAGVAVTLLIGLISDSRSQANLQIEQLKQRPLFHLGYRDSEVQIVLYMQNKGSGPLLIEQFKVINTTTGNDVSGLFFCVNQLNLNHGFNDYAGNQNNTVLSPNEEFILLLYEFDEDMIDDEDYIKGYCEDLDKIRAAVNDYKIVVDYKDVYNNKMPTYERSLSWFGRNL